MAKQAMSLEGYNVVPGCYVKVIDESVDPPRWRTIAETAYTPRHINDVMKQHGLRSCWVFWTCGKDMWFLGDQLAEPAAR